MSQLLYGLAYASLQRTYQALPVIAVGSTASAALSYVTNRYTHFTFSSPIDAAMFTGACGIAYKVFEIITSNRFGGLDADQKRLVDYLPPSLESRDRYLPALASKLTLGGLLAYGFYAIANPEKTITSFAILSVQTVASLFIAKTTVEWFAPEDEDPVFDITWFDQLAVKMVRCIYENLPRTVAAAGSAWLAAHTFNIAAGPAGLDAHTFNILKLDPKVTMVFTFAASLLGYATAPLFAVLEYDRTRSFSRVLSLLCLSKVAANKLMLNLPLYKEFAKVCVVASTLVIIFDRANRCKAPSDDENDKPVEHNGSRRASTTQNKDKQPKKTNH